MKKEARLVCYICKKFVGIGGAFGFNEGGYYHPDCLHMCGDCKVAIVARTEEYCKYCMLVKGGDVN